MGNNTSEGLEGSVQAGCPLPFAHVGLLTLISGFFIIGRLNFDSSVHYRRLPLVFPLTNGRYVFVEMLWILLETGGLVILVPRFWR